MSEGLLLQRTGPSIKRGKSVQSVGTPRAFLNAVERRFGDIRTDLAADKSNAVCEQFVSEGEDSLSLDWNVFIGTLWLNPPFANIAPWAAKCASVRHRIGWTLLLVPASVGSNWYREHVQDKALELYLNGRLTFVGSPDPYPKDLALFCFGFGARGRDTWRWA